jgi:hypothetical protein
LLLLFFNAALVIVGLGIIIFILIFVFVAAPAFLIGYIAAKILYWLYTTVVVWCKPDSYSRLHRWRPERNLLIITVIGVLIWFGMTIAIERFGSHYISFTYDVICSAVEWAAPVAAEQAVQAASDTQIVQQAPAVAQKAGQSAAETEKANRCGILIATLVPWLSRESSRAAAIAIILALAMLTLWKRKTDQAKRTGIVERPEKTDRLARPL